MYGSSHSGQAAAGQQFCLDRRCSRPHSAYAAGPRAQLQRVPHQACSHALRAQKPGFPAGPAARCHPATRHLQHASRVPQTWAPRCTCCQAFMPGYNCSLHASHMFACPSCLLDRHLHSSHCSAACLKVHNHDTFCCPCSQAFMPGCSCSRRVSHVAACPSRLHSRHLHSSHSCHRDPWAQRRRCHHPSQEPRPACKPARPRLSAEQCGCQHLLPVPPARAGSIVLRLRGTQWRSCAADRATVHSNRRWGMSHSQAAPMQVCILRRMGTLQAVCHGGSTGAVPAKALKFECKMIAPQHKTGLGIFEHDGTCCWCQPGLQQARSTTCQLPTQLRAQTEFRHLRLPQAAGAAHTVQMLLSMQQPNVMQTGHRC